MCLDQRVRYGIGFVDSIIIIISAEEAVRILNAQCCAESSLAVMKSSLQAAIM